MNGELDPLLYCFHVKTGVAFGDQATPIKGIILHRLKTVLINKKAELAMALPFYFCNSSGIQKNFIPTNMAIINGK